MTWFLFVFFLISLEPFWDGYAKLLFLHLHYRQVIAFYCCQTLFTCDQMQCATNSPGDSSCLSIANTKCRQQQQHSSVSSQHSSEESFWEKFKSGVPSSLCPCDLVPTWASDTACAAWIFSWPEMRFRSLNYMQKVLKTWRGGWGGG